MDSVTKFFDFACRLLAKRDYFTGEIRQKILAKGASAEETEKVIEKLNKFKYLDDEKVLRKYVAEISAKQKLFEKGCSDIISSKNLALFYPPDEETAAAEKALMKLENCEKEKLVRKLISRGFSMTAAIEAVRKVV